MRTAKGVERGCKNVSRHFVNSASGPYIQDVYLVSWALSKYRGPLVTDCVFT